MKDLEKSRTFYRAVLAAVGREITHEGDTFFAADELYVDAASDGVSHCHLAFQAADRETVARFHAAGLAAGGTDHDGPGERDYHPGYYAAFLLDPDGNNIEVVHHGPAARSAESVVFTTPGLSRPEQRDQRCLDEPRAVLWRHRCPSPSAPKPPPTSPPSPS